MRLSNKRPLGVDVFDAFRQGEASGRQPSTLSSHPDECSKPAIEPGGKCKAKASSGLEVPVKKQQRRKRLVVRTAGDMPFANMVKNACASAAPMPLGWRMAPLARADQRTNKRTQ